VIERPEPIFIVGVSQRAGTHFLYDLLTQHPDCVRALEADDETQGAWEDYLLDRAAPLLRYRSELSSIWSATGLDGPAMGDRLLAALGGGLSGFLQDLSRGCDDSARGRPVTKTPAAGHLDLFPRLWPHADLILIVRDPRAVVASATKTFGGLPERWVRIWLEGARSILGFMAAHPDRASLVRYEDLVTDLEGTLRPVVEQLGLDATRFDFPAAGALPARGSSVVASAGLAWQAVPVTDIGDPLVRGVGLPPRLVRRIAWLAGDEMEALGYDASPGCGSQRGLRAAGQRARDARWVLGRVGYRALRRPASRR